MNNSNAVLQVPIEDIIPNRFQPRLSFDESSLKELADSIKQHGIIQPLVLRRIADKYEIIAGERRYKAAMMAGLTSVPAILTDMDDNTSAEVAIVENVQRKDLTAIEEAKSYKALLDKGYMTQEELAKKMGLSQAAVSNKLRLLSLDETVQDAILNNKISERHARSLLKIKDLEEQKKMLNRIITERLTVRQLEEEIKKMNIEENNSSPVTENFTEQILTEPTNQDKIEEVMTNPQVEEKPSIEVNSTNSSEPPKKTNPLKKPFGSLFSNPSQVPNKFFNFLEDEAVNMSTAETDEDDIEVLDLLDNVAKPYYKEVVEKIYNLNLNIDKVSIAETDTENEHLITIKIKKDN